MHSLPDNTDVLIVGAGPAGAVTSLFLSRYGIPHVLIDQAVFPRDKICGDALSGKVPYVLNKIDPRLSQELSLDQEKFLGCPGIKFVSPGGWVADIPFSTDPASFQHPVGFVSKRIHFDQFLFSKINRTTASVYEATTLHDLERNDSGILATLRQNEMVKKISARLIVGAEGSRSLVAKKLSEIKLEDQHYCAGLRAYYKGVKNLHPQNFIELHFLKELLPGYFWIFPLANGEVNVGLGMLSAEVSRKKINLRETMLRVIREHPAMRERFANAEMIGEIKGWGLPLGSKKRKLSGDNFLLCGDAASLIDPFTGEGIGNAMISGMHAAKAIRTALQENNFTAERLQSLYDQPLFQNLWSELKLSHTLQRLSKNAWLFNFIVKKASRNKTFRDSISNMFENVDIRQNLKRPEFYLKLLFN